MLDDQKKQRTKKFYFTIASDIVKKIAL